MSEEKNVHQRLVGVMKEMGAIGKGGSTSYGEKYAYHKIDDVDDKLRQSLISNGLVAYIAEIRDRKLEYFAEESRGGKITWYAECLVLIEIVNVDKPDDKVTIVGWGQGLDYSDKATGKAISYAAKAAYLSAFHLRGQPDSEQDSIDRAPKAEDAAAVQKYIDEINSKTKLSDLLDYGQKLSQEPMEVRKHQLVTSTWLARKKALEKAQATPDL
jgi:hypothetical protein